MDALPPRFADRGVIVFDWEFDVGAAHDPSEPLGKTSGLAVLSPSLEAFVLPHLSLGVAMGFGGSTGPGQTTSSISVQPRVGYAFVFSRYVGFWPRVGWALKSTNVSTDSTSTRILSHDLELYTPIALLPIPHIEVGFGPFFEAAVLAKETGGERAPLGTTFGLAVDIGGYL
ncbi:MAG TPA: hypothetical protein VF407_03305 [Polyangiaceae bacterium]